MCPADDSHLIIEFDDYFIITPSISFGNNTFNYESSKLNETGARVKQGYEYSSLNNSFLNSEEIMHYNDKD